MIHRARLPVRIQMRDYMRFTAAPGKKVLEEKLRAIAPVSEPTSGDIILYLTVNEKYPKEATAN